MPIPVYEEERLSSPSRIYAAPGRIDAARLRSLFAVATRKVLAEHRFIIAVALLFAACGVLVIAWSSDRAIGAFIASYPLIIAGNCVLVASVAGIWTIGFLAKDRPAHPFSAVGKAFAHAEIWPQVIARGIILVPLTALVTGTFSAIKSAIPDLQFFAFDEAFIAWDAALHGGVQPWELLQPILGYAFVTNALDQAYYLWFPVLYHTFYWQIFTKKNPILRMQFIIAFLLSWMIVGSAGAVALSSAGPVFLAGLGLDASAFTGLFAYLASIDAVSEIFALRVQEMLWLAYSEGIAMPFEGISAMPSMHVAIAFLLVLFGWQRHWLLATGYALFAAMIFLGSIHLGFHYAVDGYVSVLAVAAIWWGSGKIARRVHNSDSA